MTTHLSYTIDGRDDLGTFHSVALLSAGIKSIGGTLSSVSFTSHKRTCDLSYVHHHSGCEGVAR